MLDRMTTIHMLPSTRAAAMRLSMVKHRVQTSIFSRQHLWRGTRKQGPLLMCRLTAIM